MRATSIRSTKLKAAEAVESSLCDILHQRAGRERSLRHPDAPTRDSTSAIYLWASHKEPQLLDQIFRVHLAVARERRQIPSGCTREPISEIERKRMLSAVRATVTRGRHRSHR